MNTELTIPDKLHIVSHRSDGNIEVTAETPQEMRQANVALNEWCEKKILMLTREAKELEEAYLSAKKKKWSTVTLKRHWGLAQKRVQFFAKVKMALDHGYYIVPNFPVTAFAIRTKAEYPKEMATTNRWANLQQKDQLLPAGEGEYKNPFPAIYQRDITSEKQKSEGKTVMQYTAEDWKDMEFPINMAKPVIMEATTRAMAIKAFDEMAVFPSPNRKVDPIIVGRIRNPNSRFRSENNRWVTFIIAWHLNTEVL